MGFVDKQPSRMQGQVFIFFPSEVGQGGQQFLVRLKQNELFMSRATRGVVSCKAKNLSQPRPLSLKVRRGEV